MAIRSVGRRRQRVSLAGLVLVFWWACALPVVAAPEAAALPDPAGSQARQSPARGPDPLFADAAPLRITIRGPLRSLASDKSAAPEYRPATLSYVDAEGQQAELDIRLRTRGHSRRRADVCSFPPLRVDLPKKSTLRGTVFQHQSKLKLVTFCRPTDRHQQFLMKEYITYLLFNHLTDNSFRVRLLEIDYVDTDRKDATVTRFGFFIEDKARLARRLELPLREPDSIERGQLEPAHASLVELFNYLLGNTDYSLIAAAPGRTCCHNAVLLEQPDGQFRAVPYDFDMTGFVDPPYGMVSADLKIKNVRQRLYRGFCREGEHHRAAVDQLLAAKEGLLAIVSAEPRLDERTRAKAIAYLQSGFEVLEDPAQLAQRVIDACR